MYPRIKQLRQSCGYSQKQVADMLNMHTTQYQRYESGERSIPVDFLIKLADLYHVSLDYIAGRTEVKK